MLGALVFFALVSGSLEWQMDCDRGWRLCQPYLPEGLGFPGSIEEFERSCPYILAYFNCLADRLDAEVDKCGSKKTPKAEILPDTIAYMRDACDNNSDTHAGVKKHLVCLQEHLKNQDEACKVTSNKAFNTYKDNTRPSTDINDDVGFFMKHENCHRVTSEMACFIARVEEHCETGAKDFVFDALRRTRYLDTFCYKQNSEKQLELLELLELNRLMKDRIKELLEN